MRKVFTWLSIIVMMSSFVPLTSSATESDIMSAAGIMGFKEKKNAPDFTLMDLEGKKVALKDYQGKIVLIDFWGTW